MSQMQEYRLCEFHLCEVVKEAILDLQCQNTKEVVAWRWT